jgi:hypothetical protein
MTAQIPTKKCPSCTKLVALPLVLVGEANGQCLLLFMGHCSSCKLVNLKQKVIMALPIGRADYLDLRKKGIPFACEVTK